MFFKNPSHVRPLMPLFSAPLSTSNRPMNPLTLTDPSHAHMQVIIDNLLNLELLFWAARESGNQTLKDIAVSHAIRTGHTIYTI